jgi:hypothetical protein
MKEENEKAKLLEEARSRINALLEGKMPEAMDVTSCNSQLGSELAESINLLIKSFLVLGDFIVPLANGEHDKGLPDRGALPDFPFEKIHPKMMQVINQADETVKGENLESMVDQMADKERSLSEAVDELVESRKALLEECVTLTHVSDLKAGND